MSKTKERIHDSNLRYKQGLGQNFIYDEDLLAALVASSEITKDDDVLEIGPGAGSMTKYLCDAAHHVLSIELDERLIPLLTAFLAERDNFTLVQGDVMTLNLADVTKDLRKPLSVVANIPYYITTPLLTMLLASPIPIQRMALMVQKEVADRLSEKPGSKIYGTPSVKLAWYGTAERVGTIGRNVFWPAPNVDSALVKFTRYQADDPAAPGTANSTDDGTQRELVFRLVDAAFGQRRKTLHAALKTIAPSEAFSIAGIDPTRRGETLTIAEFTALAKAIESCGDGDDAQ